MTENFWIPSERGRKRQPLQAAAFLAPDSANRNLFPGEGRGPVGNGHDVSTPSRHHRYWAPAFAGEQIYSIQPENATAPPNNRTPRPEAA